MSTPNTRVGIDQIEVRRGEVLTVWLNKADYGEPMDRVQVELRVRLDGTPEIFVDGAEVSSFDEWYHITERKP